DFGNATELGESRRLFAADRIHYPGQYRALVVADTLERATAAANLIKVDADEKEPALTLEKGKRFEPGDDFANTKYKRGNMASALRAATQGIRCTYTTPVEHHNPMEPSASTAVWDGDRLTVYEATQWVVGARNVIADTLGLKRDDVRVISRFVGG